MEMLLRVSNCRLVRARSHEGGVIENPQRSTCGSAPDTDRSAGEVSRCVAEATLMFRTAPGIESIHLCNTLLLWEEAL